MSDGDRDSLQHFVFYEPDHRGGRTFVGPFPGLEAALAYIDGDNLPDGFQCAGALPMMPPAQDAVFKAPPGPGMCKGGCGGASEFDVVAPGGMRTELCQACVEPFEDEPTFSIVPR
jgi:hypothetical protein